MIAAMCANPCVDKTVTIEKFSYGGMNRILDAREDGAGKGVNVALACAQLGLESECLGFMPQGGNCLVTDRLSAAGCGAQFVACAGSVRVNTKVFDNSTGVVTELNESGPRVSPQQVDELITLAARRSAGYDYFVLTGSTPPGCPADLYGSMIRKIAQTAPQCRIVLDTEGARLSEGLKARPYMVKPNRYELELLCGRALPTIDDVHAEALKLIEGGVQLVAVSLGGDGAYITDGNQAYAAPAMDVVVRSTAGAGDSMVAGLLLALTGGLPLEDVFRYGVAAASSSVTTVGTGLIDSASFHAFIPKVAVRRVM